MWSETEFEEGGAVYRRQELPTLSKSRGIVDGGLR